MRQRIQNLKNELQRRRGAYLANLQQLHSRQEELSRLEASVSFLEEAKKVVQLAAGKAIAQLEVGVTALGNDILQQVMRQPYTMRLNYDVRWDRGEAEIVFMRNGREYAPVDDSGYGAMDMAVFCLRISLWALKTPRTRPILFFDEPFKQLSKRHHPLTSTFIRELAARLGMQFIIGTHEDGLTEGADRVFRVENEKEVSTVYTSDKNPSIIHHVEAPPKRMRRTK